MRSVLVALGLLACGCFTFAQGPALVSSTAIPNPGEEVAFQVVGAPAGAQFRWDFNGDGRPDLTTNVPTATWKAPAGYWEVAVEVVQGGKVVSKIVGAVTAHPQLGAFRTARWNGGVLEVTVVLQAKVPLVAPGIVETVPPGWVVSVLDEGGGYAPRRGDGLEVLWSTSLEPGKSVRVVYALYPPAAGAAIRFSGTASAYSGGRRVEARIAGVVTY
ncbi:MAG: hypothetical protein N2320_03185 [Candidatus Bipolaricaulota bacterium]|nr:hypothetical protein [Candidatus Bipolaricaulota bacterium]